MLLCNDMTVLPFLYQVHCIRAHGTAINTVFCTWRATYKGRFCRQAMCAKGVVAMGRPGRVSGEGLGADASWLSCCCWYPVAIVPSQLRFARQQRGTSEFPFACAPCADLWLVGSYSAGTPVMASAASQAVACRRLRPCASNAQRTCWSQSLRKT